MIVSCGAGRKLGVDVDIRTGGALGNGSRTRGKRGKCRGIGGVLQDVVEIQTTTLTKASFRLPGDGGARGKGCLHAFGRLISCLLPFPISKLIVWYEGPGFSAWRQHVCLPLYDSCLCLVGANTTGALSHLATERIVWSFGPLHYVDRCFNSALAQTHFWGDGLSGATKRRARLPCQELNRDLCCTHICDGE